jgi:hypothetical protein
MKTKIKIPNNMIKYMVEQVLTDQYKFDEYDDGFDNEDDGFKGKVKLAMANKEFMADIMKNVRGEIEENLLDKVYDYAREFSVKSPKYYGLK